MTCNKLNQRGADISNYGAVIAQRDTSFLATAGYKSWEGMTETWLTQPHSLIDR